MTADQMTPDQTVTVSAAELQKTLVAADAGLRKYAAENEELKAQLARLNQKQAADAQEIKKATEEALAVMIENRLIRADETKVAEDRLSTLSGALGVLAKVASLKHQPPAVMGRPEKTASSNPPAPRARMNEHPEVASEVDSNYLAALGIAN